MTSKCRLCGSEAGAESFDSGPDNYYCSNVACPLNSIWFAEEEWEKLNGVGKVEMDIPYIEGYEHTGEIRSPIAGEYYFSFGAPRLCHSTLLFAKFPILRKKDQETTQTAT